MDAKSLSPETIRRRTILDLCGGTGAWSKPYRDRGYTVLTIDPYAGGGDVRLFEHCGKVWGVLAAPPCTLFARSGARWWKDIDQAELVEALGIVDACMRIVLTHKPKWWCLENPSGRLRKWLGKPVMTFQPCDYGDPWTKKTCLWGEFAKPRRNYTEPVQGSMAHRFGESKSRARLRSITPPGFAEAFCVANP